MVIDEMRKRHPDVKVVKFAQRLMFAFDDNLRGGTSREMYASFVDKRMIE